MPRPCTVCRASNRHDIDESLISGGSFREISAQFGISPTALSRHLRNHLQPQIAAANIVPAPPAGLVGQAQQSLAAFVRARRIAELSASASLRQHAVRDLERCEALLEAAISADNGTAALAVLRTKWFIAERAGFLERPDASLVPSMEQMDRFNGPFTQFANRFLELYAEAKSDPNPEERRMRGRHALATAALELEADQGSEGG